MGDKRYERHLDHILAHGAGALGELSDDGIIQGLAALAARQAAPRDAYLANVLASEAMNRLARAHAAVMHSDGALLAVDLDGAVLFANPAAEALLGWTHRELRGVHVHTLIHEREDPGAPCALERALAGGLGSDANRLRGRDAFTRKDGATVRVAYAVSPVLRDGEPQGAVMAFYEAS